jgi:hypothetical protein
MCELIIIIIFVSAIGLPASSVHSDLWPSLLVPFQILKFWVMAERLDFI